MPVLRVNGTPGDEPYDDARRRPAYGVMAARDGSWSVLGRPWLVIDAKDRRSAVEATRAAVAEWLAVSSSAFDLETG